MTGQSHSAVIPKKVTVLRTAMIGGGLSYDVYVRTKDVPHWQSLQYHATTICRDGKEYFDFSSATEPLTILAMEKGWDRYDAWREHEKAMRKLALDLAERAFPELAKYRKQGKDSLPLLWLCGLVYPQPETSDEKIVEVQS